MRLAAITALYVALNATGVFLLRDAMSGSSGQRLSSALQPALLLGVLCYGLSFVTFVLTLRSYSLSLVFPLLSGAAYAAIAIGSWAFLDEPMPLLRVAGIVAIGTGIVLVQLT